MMGYPPVDSTTQVPVSAHLTLGSLLTIVVTTTTQSLLLNPSHESYFHSSPLYSLIHAIGPYFQTIVYYFLLKSENGDHSIEQCWQRATKKQARGPDVKVDEIISLEDKGTIERPRSGTRPLARWGLFVFGALPAAMKLLSSSGLPWTTTLGMMSLVGFLLNELTFYLTSQPSKQEILPNSNKEASQEETTNVQARLKRSDELLHGFEAAAWLLFGLLHLSLLGWAEKEVYHYLITLVNSEGTIAENVKTGFEILELLLSCTILLSWLTCIIGYLLHRWNITSSINRHFNFDRVWKVSIMALMYQILLPHKWDDSWSALHRWAYDFDVITFYPFGVFWILYKVFGVVCKRWTWLGKALFMERLLLEEERKDETRKGESAMSDDNEYLALCFFLMNLGTAILWFWTSYEEEGTIALGWGRIL